MTRPNQGLSSLTLGGKMRDPGNEVGTTLFTSGDIESNSGPVVTQGNNPNNRIDTIAILISTTWLENIRCWWCR